MLLLTGLALGLCALADAYSCVHYQKLAPDTKYAITSPGWPLNFQPGESCQWVAEAPADHRVSFECDEFIMPHSNYSERPCCSNVLWASETGMHIHMDGMPFVGRGAMVTTSNILNVELRSSPRSMVEGRFHCTLSATQEYQWDRVPSEPDPSASPPQHDSCVCGWRLDGKSTSQSISGRLTGGTEPKANEFPMMAALADGKSVFCGAVIVTTRHALTSAHCMNAKALAAVDLIIGDYDFSSETETFDKQRQKLAEFIIHPSWSKDWRRANIAIAKTKEEIRFSYFTMPACMPDKANPLIPADNNMLILGYGSESYISTDNVPTSKLKYMHATLVDKKECYTNYNTTLLEEHLCSGSNKEQAVCVGDTGGPLLHEDPKTHRLTVVGIVAWGQGCTPGAPMVNTRVSSYLDWINEMTGSATCTAPSRA